LRNPRQLAFAWEQGGATLPEPSEESTPAAAQWGPEALPPNLMEQVVAAPNMRRALRRVMANKGAPGGDGMTVQELPEHLKQAWPPLRQALLHGTYQPQPVRRVEIPKPDGGKRQLGIPTVVDRLLQQALLQVLEPHYDPTFSPHSYGFRPGRSAHQAVRQARDYVQAGRKWVVDLDLERFFDTVQHDILLARLARRIPDKRLLRLLRRFLQAGVLYQGVVMERYEGTPQGGPLSPLLANILLDDLDRELTRRGHAFCRYADDCNIYVRSAAAGARVMASVVRFLEQKLRLKVNVAKSAVADPADRKFLGFRLLPGRKPEQRGPIQIAPASLKRFKQVVRHLTGRHRGISPGQMLQELGRFTNGWVGYYALSTSRTVFRDLDSWIRRRLRAFLWTQWKKPQHRYRELRQGGVQHAAAMSVCYHRMGAWRAAHSPPVQHALTNAALEARGFASLLARYGAFHASGVQR
jgi:RNA-directed DNA polymerase